MNAQVRAAESGAYAGFEPMGLADLNEVVAIEATLYSAPWTIGNFRDSLSANYSAWVLRIAMEPEDPPELLGYFLLMTAVDEAHLLNLSVAKHYQHKGFGIALLQRAIEVARTHRAAQLVLEVRPSNTRALLIYQKYGFRQIGRRAGYYPTNEGTGRGREDAIVMALTL
jgi:ribosomal-protein-alanine N-acetyltransferase